jgi:hypothetical protein
VSIKSLQWRNELCHISWQISDSRSHLISRVSLRLKNTIVYQTRIALSLFEMTNWLIISQIYWNRFLSMLALVDYCLRQYHPIDIIADLVFDYNSKFMNDTLTDHVNSMNNEHFYTLIELFVGYQIIRVMNLPLIDSTPSWVHHPDKVEILHMHCWMPVSLQISEKSDFLLNNGLFIVEPGLNINLDYLIHLLQCNKHWAIKSMYINTANDLSYNCMTIILIVTRF